MSKNNKKQLLPSIFILTFALIIFILAITFFSINVAKRENAVEITAKITSITYETDRDGDQTHSVYVSYKYKNKEYNNISLGYYTFTMKVGQEIKIYCNKDNPTDIIATGFAFYLPLVFLIPSAILFTIGFVLLNKNSRTKFLNLLRDGIVEKAKIIEINTKNSPVLVLNAESYTIKCQNVKNKYLTYYTTVSELNNQIQIGKILDVYVDKFNPFVYLIDLKSIERNNKDTSGESIVSPKPNQSNYIDVHEKVECYDEHNEYTHTYSEISRPDTINCPNCGHSMKLNAKKCPICKTKISK